VWWEIREMRPSADGRQGSSNSGFLFLFLRNWRRIQNWKRNLSGSSPKYFFSYPPTTLANSNYDSPFNPTFFHCCKMIILVAIFFSLAAAKLHNSGSLMTTHIYEYNNVEESGITT
jgi:hypothetical protein